MDFIPHDEKTILEMLDVIGVKNVNDLFKDIPEQLHIKSLDLPPGLPEPDLITRMKQLSELNNVYSASFLGAGCYYHYIPSLVDFVISRSEFYTSYTPYQAEASQGYLQAIYEYQTIISRLTNMDVTNASMYDGSTALAEAIIMASTITQKKDIILLEGIHPEYIRVIKTYCWGHGLNYTIIKKDDLSLKLNKDISAFVFQSPNFFGEILDIEPLIEQVRNTAPNCLIIQSMTDPTCLGIVKSPGELDVDIFVAEGQSFGISPSFGGPGLGIFTSKQKYLRKIPGRLVGKTKELFGDREGFLLTLQAREQHIRREKASSNICTNQALCSLAALIYLLSVGKTGLEEIAKQNFQKAQFLKKKLMDLPQYEILSTNPTYNEFVVKCPDIDKLIDECEKANLLPPLKLTYYYPDMKNLALICVTELNSLKSIKLFLKIAEKALKKGGDEI